MIEIQYNMEYFARLKMISSIKVVEGGKYAVIMETVAL